MNTGTTCNLISNKIFQILVSDSKHDLKLYDSTTLYPEGKCLMECSVGSVKKWLELLVMDVEQLTLLEAGEVLKLLTVNPLHRVEQRTVEPITLKQIVKKLKDLLNASYKVNTR